MTVIENLKLAFAVLDRELINIQNNINALTDKISEQDTEIKELKEPKDEDKS